MASTPFAVEPPGMAGAAAPAAMGGEVYTTAAADAPALSVLTLYVMAPTPWEGVTTNGA